MRVTPDDPYKEGYGQGDPVKIHEIEKHHPLDRDLLRAVQRKDICKVESLAMQGANAVRRFVIGEEKIDYSDFSRSQSMLPAKFYSHSPLMVAILNQSIDILDLLLAINPLSMYQTVHLFKYAIGQHKNLALALLLRRKGFLRTPDPGDDIMRYAMCVQETDAAFIMGNERDHPGWCGRHWGTIQKAVYGGCGIQEMFEKTGGWSVGRLR